MRIKIYKLHIFNPIRIYFQLRKEKRIKNVKTYQNFIYKMHETHDYWQIFERGGKKVKRCFYDGIEENSKDRI